MCNVKKLFSDIIPIPSAGVATDFAEFYGLHCLNPRKSERTASIRVPPSQPHSANHKFLNKSVANF